MGKGGSGKSAIAGTFARALARRGEPVLAVDSDPMPGLAFSLGIEADDAPIPEEAVVERAEGDGGPRFRLRPGLGAAEAIERYAAVGPDGVRFLQLGKLRGHVGTLVRSQFAFRQIVEELPEGGWHLIGDLPGGTRQPFAGWGDYARVILVVAEPSAKSLLSARRLTRLALAKRAPDAILAVASKVREPADVGWIGQRTGLEVVAAVPFDDELGAAERAGLAPIDAAPACPAVRAVESLVDRLCEERVT